MEDTCEICGDIGFPDEIRACTRCKISLEHSYCRRPISEITESWLCEKCEFGTTASPKSVQKDVPEPLNPDIPKWRKNSKAAKTIFLNTQEVIMLSSGAKKSTFSSRRVVPSTSGPYRSSRPNLETAIKPKAPIQKPSLLNVGGGSDLRRSGPSRPACVRINISSANQQEVIRESKDLKEKNVAQAPRSEHRSGKEIRSPSRKDKMARKEAPCSTSQLLNGPPIMSSRKNLSCADASAGVEPRKGGDLKGKLVNAPPEGEIVQGPARDSSWRGSFKVSGTANLQELIVAINAHTSAKVLRKVREFSEGMPEVLCFEPHPRLVVWKGIFQDYCPGKNDIGMYLFSSSSKRSENYVRLLEFMEASDSALITSVNDVELLVFSSKCLSADAQRWGSEHFLWGLFRRVKKQKAAQKGRDMLPPPPPPPPPPVQPPTLASNREVTSCHMEIDMIGGREVGIPDIPAPREPSRKSLGSGPRIQPPPVLRNCSFPTQPPVLPGVRKQPSVSVPPGFEDAHRNRGFNQRR